MSIDLERFSEFDDKYEFMDDLYKEGSTIPIRLTDKKYYGTILKYDTIKVKEVYDDETAMLNFSFDFIENPLKLKLDDKKFNNHIGDLLVNIIINTLNGNENENRNDNPKSVNS